MANNPAVPFWEPGQSISCKTTAAVTGKRFVAISGNGAGSNPLVAHASAGGRIFGVAAFDAASGAVVSVLRGGVVPVTAASAITAGQEVEVGANGQAAPKSAGVAVGVAVFDASPGADAAIALYQ
ncbi:hypothetical protein LI90_4379 (plasmid) [Carbonactinospora thermoautotrophica]|uniref:DUF2190 domain-containing protein n=1 Tax=Carbonactinospora thermoautotrophica TaxID=1469144 RepID=A0A132MHU9_9ACTN|nr:DUF2190 family protein [Carbonactinospora thermoautotrophica]KWW97407.1 hypothetical protein LI90_4379 [Carbonactinospora thermoautotrophica]